MNWPVQIFYVVLTVSLAVKSSSSASHNQGPRLVANHHSMRRSASGGAPANHHSMRQSAAHHSMRRSVVRVEPSQHAPECGGRGRAWTVIADTPPPSEHPVLIPTAVSRYLYWTCRHINWDPSPTRCCYTRCVEASTLTHIPCDLAGYVISMKNIMSHLIKKN